ncbi:MAG: TRL-like family protein [Planctomycetota bacterium]
MKAILVVLCAGTLMVGLSGCAGMVHAPIVPPPGLIYSGFKAPLDGDMDPTVKGSKTGSAYTECILGWVAWGDASVHTAASNGGLTKVHHADYEMFNVLGVYSKFTVRVYGE